MAPPSDGPVTTHRTCVYPGPGEAKAGHLARAGCGEGTGFSGELLQPRWPTTNDLLLFFYSIFVNMYGMKLIFI